MCSKSVEIKVRVPLSIQRLADNKIEFKCHGDTIEELFLNMERTYPGVDNILWDEKGKINSHLILSLNGKIIRSSKREITPLKDGDEVLIIQLIAGG